MRSGGSANSSRNAATSPATLASRRCSPLISSVSSAAASTLVRVVKPSSVIDSEGVAGTLPRPGRLPQYLTKAMFGWATATAMR